MISPAAAAKAGSRLTRMLKIAPEIWRRAMSSRVYGRTDASSEVAAANQNSPGWEISPPSPPETPTNAPWALTGASSTAPRTMATASPPVPGIFAPTCPE